MYVSVPFLHEDLGVDITIARFFVDRKIPTDNIFWEKRLLYVGRGNGYMSIPIYYDLLHRIGVPLDCLLAEDHVRLMERVMHFAMLVEFGKISFANQLVSIGHLFEERATNPLFLAELNEYLRQPVLKPMDRLGLSFPALNRADVFLFILADLPMSPHQINEALKYWYALHPTYLIMDDFADYAKDKDSQEENLILSLGDGADAFAKAFVMLNKNTETLRTINPLLAAHLTTMVSGLTKFIPNHYHGTR